jgi:hypothetical protein
MGVNYFGSKKNYISCGPNAQIGPRPHIFRFLEHTQLDAHNRCDCSERLIRTSMFSGGIETAIPTKRLQAYALACMATKIGQIK